jgi:hypothetical protein
MQIQSLLAACIPAWRLTGHIGRVEENAIEVVLAGKRMRVEVAADGLPFRYVLVAEGRTRGVTSIAALLRAIRTLADPDYRRVKLRMAPFPVLVP